MKTLWLALMHWLGVWRPLLIKCLFQSLLFHSSCFFNHPFSCSVLLSWHSLWNRVLVEWDGLSKPPILCLPFQWLMVKSISILWCLNTIVFIHSYYLCDFNQCVKQTPRWVLSQLWRNSVVWCMPHSHDGMIIMRWLFVKERRHKREIGQERKTKRGKGCCDGL